MSPFSSPATECNSCATLSQKITRLEKRISLLCKIKEDEKHSDTVFAASHTAALDPADHDIQGHKMHCGAAIAQLSPSLVNMQTLFPGWPRHECKSA